MTYATFAKIRSGDAGIIDTLDLMSEYIQAGIDNPTVVQFARRLAVSAGVRNQYAQAQVIRAFLSRVWRFVNDPHDRELLAEPEVSLREHLEHGIVTGDCDEAAIFGATLGRAVGLYAQLVVYEFATADPDASLAHVFAVLLTDAGETVSLDVTRPRGPVPAPSRVLAIDV